MKKYLIAIFISMTLISILFNSNSVDAAIPGQARVFTQYGYGGNCRVSVQIPSNFVRHQANIYIGNLQYHKSSNYSSYGARINAYPWERVDYGYRRSN